MVEHWTSSDVSLFKLLIDCFQRLQTEKMRLVLLLQLLCTERAALQRSKSYPECVKKKGCCQDKGEVSSHRGEQASQGRLDQERKLKAGRFSFEFFPDGCVFSVFLVWPFGTSLLALRECAAALLRVCPALSTAGERCAQHQGAGSDPSSRHGRTVRMHAHTRGNTHAHLKQ